MSTKCANYIPIAIGIIGLLQIQHRYYAALEFKILFLSLTKLNFMNSINIQTEKLNIIEWLVKLQDQTIIEKIKFLIKNPKISTDWWDTISESEKMSIDQGLADIENRKVTAHAKVRKNYEKWL
ncbi:MAG: hypothetical protein COZ59_07530 [Bacteroidetes bacterium CG_4_8_14_3_um_filter_31_14]|nr:MAG: hypothetical protein COZ59_07530 [Bacteroidetes bacterium CG_4_8_14_3_um_filter_31_14]